MNDSPLRFTPELLAAPSVRSADALTTLRHFAIISYAVTVDRLRPHIDPHFEFDAFHDANGKPVALLSVVCFEDQDFRFAGCSFFKFKFGQTNYRAYVIDRRTGRHAVWFFGTTLDSALFVIPRYLWKLPWHRGRIHFDCQYDPLAHRYTRYRMTTRSPWAPVELAVEDTGQPLARLDGFPDLEAALVMLTHPLTGVYRRRDYRLGTYSVWHDRLHLATGNLTTARFDLLDRLHLVPFAEQLAPHSVLLQHATEFMIHLPPEIMKLKM